MGIRTLEISEVDTSNTCFNCRTKDKKARKTQGLFPCGNCSIRTNADYNGAMNILQRGVGILSTLGGFLTYPEPSMIIERNKMIMKERVSSELKEPPLRRGCQSPTTCSPAKTLGTRGIE
jgi:transposase